MPSCSAARMISVPAGHGDLLAVDRQGDVGGRGHRRGHLRVLDAERASSEADVLLELFAEMLQARIDHRRRPVGQRAEGAEHDVLAHVRHHRDVLGPAVPVGDPPEHPLRPPGPLAARRALAARLVRVEAGHPLGRVDHTVGVVEDHHRPGPEQRAGRRHGLVVERRVDVLGGEQRRRGPAGRPCLQRAPVQHPAGDVLQEDPERRPERELVVARALDLAGDREELRAR